MSPTENFRENVPLAPLTTLGLGGKARYFVACHAVEQVRRALVWAAERDLPVQVLGGGSNTVFADEGFAGLVLHLALAGVDFADEGDSALVDAAAGEDWDGLVAACVGRGLAGIECLSGIPGLIGATPIQNVGAYGQEVAETLVDVRALDRRTLEEVTFSNAECGFAYRQSRFKGADRDRYIITRVRYRLRPGGRPAIRYAELQRHLEQHSDLEKLESGAPVLEAVRRAVLAIRRAKSMLLDPTDPEARSAGSFFLNPVLDPEAFARLQARWGGNRSIPHFAAEGGIKVPAAWLVEQAGFHKGYQRGGAGISSAHALALVNRGGSTRELLALARDIQRAVHEQFAVRLEPEPVLVASEY